MSENKEYISQELENGSIQISEDVIVSIAAMAAQEVEGVYGLGGAGNGFAQPLGKFHECLAIRCLSGFKFLETLVAGDDEEIVHAVQQVCQLVPCLQLILGIVFLLLTFLTIFVKKPRETVVFRRISTHHTV